MHRSPAPLTALAVALFVMPCGVLAAQVQGFSYAPGTATYRMVVRSTGTSEATGVKRELGMNAQELVTLVVTPHSLDTLALTIRLDSASVSSPAVGAIDPSPAIGMKVSAMLSPQGRIYSKQLPDMSGREAFVPVANEMARFLPIVPAELHTGLVWSDTITEPVTQMGVEIKQTRITDYRVAGDTSFAGERAWRIDRVARVTLSGAGSAMGTPLTFDGTATGSGMLFISHAGRYLGADLTDEVKSRVSIASLGREIVGSQTQVTQITLLR
ncbi:MAG TPA: hypothetical protein VJU87_01445 [Gemmatimonadaceae bacterium]|nr:hypothetical protein [Gemmatimonadaceae bacterium]